MRLPYLAVAALTAIFASSNAISSPVDSEPDLESDVALVVHLTDDLVNEADAKTFLRTADAPYRLLLTTADDEDEKGVQEMKDEEERSVLFDKIALVGKGLLPTTNKIPKTLGERFKTLGERFKTQLAQGISAAKLAVAKSELSVLKNFFFDIPVAYRKQVNYRIKKIEDKVKKLEKKNS